MSAIVLIPVWRRPEMLAICLKRIQEAKGAKQNFYLFQLDEGFDTANIDLINAFPFESDFNWKDFSRSSAGNTANILKGLETALYFAAEKDVEIIHLLEEDVWIAKDYFATAEAIHKQFNPWVVSLCRNQHRSYEPIPDKSLIYYDKMYQSLGVSFPLDSIREILVHNTEDYFKDMTRYLQILFPKSRFGSLFPEQDGLIQRIIEKNDYKIAYANIPRAFHAGFYSYHRSGKEPEGSLYEKVAQLESMSEEEMNQRSVYKDIRFCNLEGYNVQEFFLE